MNVSETDGEANMSNLGSKLEITLVQQYNEENEAVETRRRELGQIQQDLRMLMDRLNDFIVGNTFSYNPEELNSSAGDHLEPTKNEIKTDKADYVLCNEILAAEVEKHLKDMREIQNLSVLTNVLMNRIRKVTHLDTAKNVDRIQLLEAEREDKITVCAVKQHND